MSLFLFCEGQIWALENSCQRGLGYENIIVFLKPYSSVESALNDEKNIDWDTEKERAKAITAAFAAIELKNHFALLEKEMSISQYEKNKFHRSIVLVLKEEFELNFPAISREIKYEELGNQGFSLLSKGDNLFISANTREGLLYGAYDFLKQIGFKWYRPNEIIPPKKANSIKRNKQIVRSPYFELRGFWTFSDEFVTEEWMVWLARNKFNLVGKAQSYLAKKLGLKVWGGEHNLVQEEFSREGLYEEHPDWFTLSAGKRIRVREKGNYVNPSFSNLEAAKYFAGQMILRLKEGLLDDVDILNVWPADGRKILMDESET